MPWKLKGARSDPQLMEAEATIAFAERSTLRVNLAIALVFVVALHFVYTFDSDKSPLIPWLVSVAIGLAAMLAGGILGLLFAVPRRVSESRASESGYSANDNLVKISDWLTSALTGIALATASSLSSKLWELCGTVNPDYPGFALAAVVGGGASGFLLAYLRLRATLPFIFAHYERRAADAAAKSDRASSMQRRNRESVLARWLEVENRDPEIMEGVRSLAAKVRTIRRAMHDPHRRDPNKAAFGGSDASDGYRLALAGYRVEPCGPLHVELEVRQTRSGRMPVQATFHLHPSFPEPVIEKPSDPDGVVRLALSLIETFTVGVIVEPGGVLLELDLSASPELPEEYRAESAA